MPSTAPSPRRPAARRLALARAVAAARATTLLAVLLFAAGCPTQEQLARMPGLGDVTPLGPAGKKCYDHCAQLKVHCDHMCPRSMGICREDCVTESKICLKDCPELQRPVYPED